MVRFSEHPSVRVSVDVAAPPEQVWRLVSDIDLPARFSAEFQGAEWIDEPGPGARFVGRNRHELIGSWETTSWVTVYEPHRSFGWAVERPDDPVATWRFDLEETAGGTRLTFTAGLGPGPSAITELIAQHPDKEEKIIGRRLAEWQANMEATLAGIKELAEAAPDRG